MQPLIGSMHACGSSDCTGFRCINSPAVVTQVGSHMQYHQQQHRYNSITPATITQKYFRLFTSYTGKSFIRRLFCCRP